MRRSGTKGDAGQHSRIVVADRRGADVQTLIGSDDFTRPVWAADGDYLFAISYDLPAAIGRWSWSSGEKTIIPIRDLDANCDTARGISLYPPGLRAAIQSISLSPSGRQAALLCSFQHIYIADVELDSVRILRMLPLSLSYVSIPGWLDDDRLLVVGRSERGAPAILWQIDVQSGFAQNISTSGLNLGDRLAISPDRRSIVVTATLSNAAVWSLWRVELHDGQSTRLTMGVEDTAPSWTR